MTYNTTEGEDVERYGTAEHEQRYLDAIMRGDREWSRMPATEIRTGDVVVYMGAGCTEPVVRAYPYLGEITLDLPRGTYRLRKDQTPLVGRLKEEN